MAVSSCALSEVKSCGALAELDDLGLVRRVQRLHETDGGGLGLAQLHVHRGGSVDQYRQRDRQVLAGEDRDGLADPLLQHFEINLSEVGDESALGIGDGHGQVDDVHPRLEDREPPGGRGWRLRAGEARAQEGDRSCHGNETHAHPSPRRLGRTGCRGRPSAPDSIKSRRQP